jgi:hypothetical protein
MILLTTHGKHLVDGLCGSAKLRRTSQLVKQVCNMP